MSNIVTDFSTWSEITNGNGSTTRIDGELHASTGTSSDAYGIAYKAMDISWDQKVDTDFNAWFREAGIAISVFSWLRLSAGIAARSDLESEGIQIVFRRNGMEIFGQSHDGTALESTLIGDTWLTPDFNDDYHRWRMVLTPGVKVEFYYDDVLIGTNTVHIPSGSGAGVKVAVGATHPSASGSYGQGVSVTEIIGDVAESANLAGYVWMEGSHFRGFDENAIERKYVHTNDLHDEPSDPATENPISTGWA